MDWKQSLDRYLTTEPDDSFDSWAESTTDKLSDKFFEDNEEWVLAYTGQYNYWMNKLFYNGRSPEQSARIIERAFSIYKIK